MKLNLGGGNQNMPGWTSVDLFAEGAAIKADLFKFPWPWEDNSIEAVAMFHFLEHVEELERTIMEVHRILKPGGRFWVIVPHARNPAAHDIGHRFFFTCCTFQAIANDGTERYYQWGGKQIFATESFKMPVLQWKFIRWTPLDFISARWPVAYEKFIPIAPAWIEWVGRKV
jgi:SAM-dependent methyltransferase